MPKLKSDEQTQSEFEPKIKSFGNERLPTRDELNERIVREAKEVYDRASIDDLSNFNSEAETKYRLQSELCEIFMSDEMVQALTLKDNVLDDVYRFYLAENKDNQAFLAVFDYLEKLEHDYIADRLYDCVHHEYEEYVDEVKKLPPEKIIEEAYKLTILYDLQAELDPYACNISTEQLKALTTLDSPLWSIYQEWQHRDFTHMDDIIDVITETADKTVKEIGKDEIDTNHCQSLEYDNDLENDDGQEL